MLAAMSRSMRSFISAYMLLSTYMWKGVGVGVPSARRTPGLSLSLWARTYWTVSSGGGEKVTRVAQDDLDSSNEGSSTSAVASSVLALAMGSKLGGLVLLPKIDADGTHKCGPYEYAKAAATSG